MLAIVIPEHITSADVRSSTSSAPFIPFSQLRFSRMAAADELGDLYPMGLGRRGLSARVRLDCEVLPNLNLFCLNPQVSGLEADDPALDSFQLAGLQASGFFLATPELANGQAAPGVRFRMTFQFEPPPYDQ